MMRCLGLAGGILLMLGFLGGCSGGAGGATGQPPTLDPNGDGEERGSAYVASGGTTSGSGGSVSGGSLTAAPADVSSGMGSTSGSVGGTALVQAGILTAGAWDDNRNFDRFLKYEDGLAQQKLPGLMPFGAPEFAAGHDAASLVPHQTLDVSLVIDTTGSMGDEIAYLQSEFLALSQTILEKYPSAEQRWSLVLYRDTVDEYIVRWFNFRSDPNDFRTHLAAQGADGGGDFPESPERGLATAAKLSWRDGPSTAKLAFWVADAPHHEQNATAMAEAIGDVKARGVHIYPVAASGVDDLTEASMRAAAQLTGGRYLFLTNDSGVGGDHKEPSIPCYFVTKLNQAIVRMVDIEMSGTYREPAADEILRTGGDPQAGVCQLSAEETVTIF